MIILKKLFLLVFLIFGCVNQQTGTAIPEQKIEYNITFSELWDFSNGLDYIYQSNKSVFLFEVKSKNVDEEEVWAINQTTNSLNDSSDSIWYVIYRSKKDGDCIKMRTPDGYGNCDGVNAIYPLGSQKPVKIWDTKEIKTKLGRYNATRYDFDVIMKTGLFDKGLTNRVVFWKAKEVPVPLKSGIIYNIREYPDLEPVYDELINWSN